jgi:predicted CXXCH cytochrome family protein
MTTQFAKIALLLALPMTWGMPRQAVEHPVRQDKNPNSAKCLECHAVGVHTPATGSRHAALDMGCNVCHLTHKEGPSSDLELTQHLRKSSPALCLECHDAKDANLAKVHNNQPFEKADCVACHSPHESDKPKLMRAFMHPPFADKQCQVCHAAAKDGKVVLTAASSTKLCVICHAKQAKVIDSATMQHRGAWGDCTDCHNPHASRQSGLPKSNLVDICLTCHTDKADMLKTKKVHHQPAFQEGCSTCHEPHGGENPHLLRAKEVNTLCLECHGPDAHERKPVSGQLLVPLFDSSVKLPQSYFKKVPILHLKQGAGHPVEKHPVANTIDVKTQTPVLLTCLSCHQPHASANAGLLIKDQENNLAFCKACHAERALQLP